MAFFDDIGKAISDATQSVAQKGKDFSDTNKFNSMITNEERAIEYTYGELGKLYVEKYKDNYDKDMLELVNRIKESETRIEEYKSKVQTLRNVQVCPQCGLEIKKGDLFCPSCGFRMPEVAPKAQPMGMQNNGNVVDAAPLQTNMQQGAPNTNNSMASTFCSNCGAPVVPGNSYCMQCGAHV